MAERITKSIEVPVESGDEYDLQTGRMLGPCTCEAECGHCAPCQYGDAVAGALREAGTRRRESDDALAVCHKECADLRREVERLKEQESQHRATNLRIEQARKNEMETHITIEDKLRDDLRREVERLEEQLTGLRFSKSALTVAGQVKDNEIADLKREVERLTARLAEYLVEYRLEDKP